MLERSGVLFEFKSSEIEAVLPQDTVSKLEQTKSTQIEPQTHPDEITIISSLANTSGYEPEAFLDPQISLKVTKPPRKQNNYFHKFSRISTRALGFALIFSAIGGLLYLFGTQVRMEIQGRIAAKELANTQARKAVVPLPKMVSPTFEPLIGTDGKQIVPINTDFAIIIPKFNINSPVVGSVNPFDAKEYGPALKKGVAHAKTSYFPNQEGSVYLFSHSTNYEWFIRDLNALFYNVKDLTDGDYIILVYQGIRYTYEYKSREIVAPKNTAFILPVTGKRQLILQTCWPPGSTTQRLLVFADLVDATTLSP